MKKRIYLSGAITDNPNYKKEFAESAKYLKKLGFKVVNPASYPLHKNWTWEDYMKRDIRLLMQCDEIVFINDCKNSKGSNLERYIAEQLGIKIAELSH